MDLYKIPNDNGSPHRQLQFLSLLKDEYIDGACDYCLLIPFAEEFNLSDDDRIYLAMLYGLCYSQTTVIRTYLKFPKLNEINKKDIEDWWVTNKNSLYFNPDKRRIKSTNQFAPSILQLKQMFGKDIEKNIIKCIGKNYSFETFYNFILKDWKNYGAMGAYLFFDAIYGLIPRLYKEPKSLDWKQRGATVVEGMAHYCYLDEQIKTKKYNYKLFDKQVQNIHKKTGVPLIQIESTLCAYRKFFKETRYAGYYADRMLEECLKYQKYIPNVNLMKYRALTIPAQYRSELKGKKGIDKKRLKDFRQRGIL